MVKLLAAYGHTAALSGILPARYGKALRDDRAALACTCVGGPVPDPYHRRVSGATVTGIFMELENVLAPVEDDGLRWAADAPGGAFDAQAFVRANGTLYLTDEKGGDQKRSPRVPVVLALVDQLTTLPGRGVDTNTPWSGPLTVVRG